MCVHTSGISCVITAAIISTSYREEWTNIMVAVWRREEYISEIHIEIDISDIIYSQSEVYLGWNILANINVGFELNAFLGQQTNSSLDNFLGQLHGWYTILQQASHTIISLKHSHHVPCLKNVTTIKYGFLFVISPNIVNKSLNTFMN